MYEHARSRLRVGCNLSEEFSVKMSVHQNYWLRPPFFITVLEALSQGFYTGCPWNNLYADDLVIDTESLEEELQEKLVLWKTNMEKRAFGSTWAKPRSWYLGLVLDVVQESNKDPCDVSPKDARTNSCSVVVVPVASTRNVMVSLALWSLIPASGVIGVLDRLNQ